MLITTLPPRVKATIEKYIRQSPDPIERKIRVYFKACGIELMPFQLEESLKWFYNPINLWRWGRGFSKTFMLSYLSVFIAILKLRTAYFVPWRDQLDQVEVYFDNNPFVDQRGRNGKKANNFYYIDGKRMIKLSILRSGNTKSGRFHHLVFDEVADLDIKREPLIDTAKELQSSLPHVKTTYISTPKLGTYFQRKEDYLIKTQYGNISHRNFVNTPVNMVSDTPEKALELERSREESIELGLLWLWEQNKLAIYTTCGESAFPNLQIDYTISNLFTPTHIGFDFHGADTGHMAVGWFWNPEKYQDVYCVYEYQHRYKQSDTAMQSLKFIEDFPVFRHAEKFASDYGYNAGFAKDAREYDVRCREENKKGVAGLVYNALKFKIHINPSLTPHVYNDFKNAYYDNQAEFDVHKEKTGEEFRNHWLDAGLMGLPNILNKMYLLSQQTAPAALSGEEYRKVMMNLRQIYQKV